MAICTCADQTNGSDTAKVFFELVADGGYAAFHNKQVAADDEEMVEALHAMCALVTRHIIKLYHTYGKGKGTPYKYTDEDFKKLEKAEKKVVEKWIDEVFGSNAKLEGHNWIEKV